VKFFLQLGFTLYKIQKHSKAIKSSLIILERDSPIKMSGLAKPRVVVIGELNVDIVATGLRDLPQLGGEILARDLRLTLGSASAIFASGIAKLGHPVTFISQIGADDFGKFCLNQLRASGVSTRHVSRTFRDATGVTIALSTGRDRALVTYPGAIATLRYPQLKMSLLKGHQHLHMTSYFLQGGLRADFPKIFRQARSMGLTTSFDPNSDPAGAWSIRIRDVLTNTDVLFVNEGEAIQLSRARGLRSALRKLGQLVTCAVIKQGGQGSVAIKDGKITSAPGFRIKALDTTGAGDSFAAGFLSAYLRGLSLAECLETGNACGALSTLRPGGTQGQPDEKELRTFLRAAKKKGHPRSFGNLNAK
jgi:sugar/nucleoside kinase (ribokinase family)